MVWGTKSRHERGYGAAWDRLRKRIMTRDCGLCQVCRKAGRVGVAYAVDHIVSKANAARLKWTPVQVDDESNLQSICRPCHDLKSQAEQGKTKKVAIGVDGWPIERTEAPHRALPKRDHIAELLQPSSLSPSGIPLTIVCGPPAGGKSTFIEQSRQPGDLIIDMDAIRIELGIDPDQWDTGVLTQMLERRNELLQTLATSTASRAWFIVSAPRSQDREWWRSTLKPDRIVIVLASRDTCSQRARAERTGRRLDQSLSGVSKWWSEHTNHDGHEVISTG